MKINFILNYITFLIFLILHENWTSGSSNSKIVYEDLKVPYVPHVVVNKSFNEFDYNQLQEAIMRTLQKKQNVGAGLTVIEESVQKGSTLYDYLKTNNNNNQQYNNPVIEPENLKYIPQINQENIIENNYVNKIVTTTPKIYTRDIAPTSFKLQNINLGGNSTAKFNIPYKENFHKNSEIQKLEKITVKSPVSITHAPNVLGELKCNLKSLRFITDGECYSKEPVIETVCADKCIQQTTSKFRRNSNIMNARMASPRKYPSLQALHCVESETTKQKVKLYCKNGAVINNVINVVTDCTCTMHSEQVFFHSLPSSPSIRNRRTYLRNSRSRNYANSFKPYF